MDASEQLIVIAKVVVAFALGGLIGFEREIAHKSAGFRTHMLVAGAATLIIALGRVLADHYADHSAGDLVRTDPVRTIEAIVAGVGFLGAGTIIQRARAGRVEGLTTAASLLMSASIGIAVALHQFIMAVGVTLLTLVALRVLGRIERKTIPS